MKFLKLTIRGARGVSYVEPSSITVVTADTHTEGSYITTAYDGQVVDETPEQIFELIRSATGEDVHWYSRKIEAEEPDAGYGKLYPKSDEAIGAEEPDAVEFAYARGVKDTIDKVRAAIGKLTP